MEEKNLSFASYCQLFSLLDEEGMKEQMEAVAALPRYGTVCGREVPENLNLITYGQLDDLHDSAKGVNGIVQCFDIILGVKEGEVMAERADKVLWFVHFCNSEVERINKIFASINPEYTNEERMAGIERMSFGSFGVLDWYARRMGIADQEVVRSVPWVRIFRCMKNDNEERRYNLRLRDVYANKIKRR